MEMVLLERIAVTAPGTYPALISTGQDELMPFYAAVRTAISQHFLCALFSWPVGNKK
jgi:hypothetical protein